MRRSLLLAGVAVTVAAIVTGAGTAKAGASRGPAPANTIGITGTTVPVKHTVTVLGGAFPYGAMRPQGPRAALLGGCPELSRTSACDVDEGITYIYTNGAPSGWASFDFNVDWETSTKSSDFTAHITFTTVAAYQANGLTETFAGDCLSPCTSDGGSFTVSAIPGETSTGTLHFFDLTDKVNKNHPGLMITDEIPAPGTGSTAFGRAKHTIRCDDLITDRHAGCVIEEFKPTLTTMATLPHIAANIRDAQESGGLGVPDSDHPLHRQIGESKRRANYRAVCGKKKPPAEHKGWWCDEYPFASTREGGKATPEADRRIAFVPPGEQQSQGGLLKSFYTANRMLDGDPFYVSP